jgi:penicillin amidase
VIGRNTHLAWGVTILTADMIDYVVETLHPEDFSRYLVAGEGEETDRPFALREEVIHVRGAESVTEVVQMTHHGPVIDPDWRPGRVLVRAALPPGKVGALSAVIGFDQAVDFDSFALAAAAHDQPGENLLYADVEGNIGYVAAGEFHQRVAHSGLLPAAGRIHGDLYAGRDDPASRPRGLNPRRGFLESANNRVVRGERGDTWNRAWIRADRAGRVRELLSGDEQSDAGFLQAMQGDTWSRQAALLLDALQELQLTGEWTPPAGEDSAARAWGILAPWDRHYSTGPAPGLHALFQDDLLRRVFADEAGESFSRWAAAGLLKLLDGSRFLDGAMESVSHDWWDDISTPDQVETMTHQVNRSLASAWEEMQRRAPHGVETWDWPDLHHARFRHPLGRQPALGWLFNGPDLPVQGGGGVLLANAFSVSRSFDVFAVPAMRMLADLSPDGGLRIVVPAGQSGVPASRHYQDQAVMWRDMQDMEIYREEWQAVSTLLLEPSP